MESQPQNPEFRYNPENFHPCSYSVRNKRSYVSANLLLNLLNKVKKKDKMQRLPSILSLFPNEFSKFNNTGD